MSLFTEERTAINSEVAGCLLMGRQLEGKCTQNLDVLGKHGLGNPKSKGGSMVFSTPKLLLESENSEM